MRVVLQELILQAGAALGSIPGTFGDPSPVDLEFVLSLNATGA